jgi:chitin synthase
VRTLTPRSVLSFSNPSLVRSSFIFHPNLPLLRSKIKYLIVIYGFGILTAYMLAAAVLCTIKAAQHPEEPIFRQMIVSVSATYGVYVVSSILALDPWHLFTSFLQYILLSPTYVNVLSM